MKPLLTFIVCWLSLGACYFSSSHHHSLQAFDTLALSTDDNLLRLQDHDTLGKEFARQQIHKLVNSKKPALTWDTLIKNASTAIAIAEPILFDLFDKDQILSERPYEVYLIDSYWYIGGTIRKGWIGGGFEIILSAKDGKIIRLVHYK